MAASRIQTAKASNTSSTTVAATWGASTTAGNFLVATVLARSTSVVPVLSAPAGWTQAVVANNSVANYHTCGIFYYENAGAQSATGNFSATAAEQGMALVVAEYSGVLTASSLDQTVGYGDNTSTTAHVTGTTGTTTQANELVIAGIGSGAGSYGTPTNGFTLVDQASEAGTNALVAFLEKSVTSTGTQSTALTADVNSKWATGLATFFLVSAAALGSQGKRRTRFFRRMT